MGDPHSLGCTGKADQTPGYKIHNLKLEVVGAQMEQVAKRLPFKAPLYSVPDLALTALPSGGVTELEDERQGKVSSPGIVLPSCLAGSPRAISPHRQRWRTEIAALGYYWYCSS